MVLAALSSLLLALAAATHPARAHEVLPAIADMTAADGKVVFDISANIEGFIAGIDLSAVADTNEAAGAADYDALRALGPAALEERFRAFWPAMAAGIDVRAGDLRLEPSLVSVGVPDTGNVEIARTSTFRFETPLPEGTAAVTVGWNAAFGTLVLRQQGVAEPYDGFLEAGAVSDPITLSGGFRRSALGTFAEYVPVGFDHIVPKGLDHILFVLGLFFLSTQMRPLLWQVTAFTLAHTITLALASLGYVRLPGSIVEPLIAASIVFVAVENLFTSGLSPWRPFVVFGFGLLHGLGFASVLADFGLPKDAFVPALVGFNVGVELGQLFVILIAWLAVGAWFGNKPWYKARIANPASVVIALVGSWWVVERVFL